MQRILPLTILIIALVAPQISAQPAPGAPAWIDETIQKLEGELVEQHGEEIRPRLRVGLAQAASFWRPEDGNAAVLENFVRTHFAADEATRDAMFDRMQIYFEQVGGLNLELVRQLRMHVDVEQGPILPFDRILAGYNPAAHISEDFFANKIAFVILLNFPIRSLEEKLDRGEEWSRREWAEARLAETFKSRVPAEVNQAVSAATAKAGAYIAEYNIWMHHLVDEDGNRLFQPGLRLISHWNLRDELKGNYGQPEALPKQKMIQQVMERIVTQTIPEAVINDPRVDWNPYTNTISPSDVVDYDTSIYPPLEGELSNRTEPSTRYEMLLDVFRAVRRADPYNPTNPTLIDRRFNENREMPEERVRAIFESVMTSPLVGEVAALIESRLGRGLLPFDIWYNGFRASGEYSEAELDRIVAERYPDAEAFRQDIPNILRKLDFDPEVADYVASRIEVHPSRGAGHAFGAGRRGDMAYLRTRIEPDGMNYKGYNIAVHELGHNVEQVLSIDRIDHTLLEGVPNTAFTEALAFVFQARDLELLGLATPTPESEAMKVLADFWGAYEIAGVALVDMGVWHYMYDNPDATPEQLRDATVHIARDVWNDYFAPVFGEDDVLLLGIYSHMISNMLYIPDYPLGRLIAFQIQQQMDRAGAIGPEFTRMSLIGNVTPDAWMKQATGHPVGAEALLESAAEALKIVAGE
jgi:hypothetical protein